MSKTWGVFVWLPATSKLSRPAMLKSRLCLALKLVWNFMNHFLSVLKSHILISPKLDTDANMFGFPFQNLTAITLSIQNTFNSWTFRSEAKVMCCICLTPFWSHYCISKFVSINILPSSGDATSRIKLIPSHAVSCTRLIQIETSIKPGYHWWIILVKTSYFNSAVAVSSW